MQKFFAVVMHYTFKDPDLEDHSGYDFSHVIGIACRNADFACGWASGYGEGGADDFECFIYPEERHRLEEWEDEEALPRPLEQIEQDIREAITKSG
jgi:hypothetical protein